MQILIPQCSSPFKPIFGLIGPLSPSMVERNPTWSQNDDKQLKLVIVFGVLNDVDECISPICFYLRLGLVPDLSLTEQLYNLKLF